MLKFGSVYNSDAGAVTYCRYIYIYKHTFESDDSVGCRNYVAGLQQGYSKWEVVF